MAQSAKDFLKSEVNRKLSEATAITAKAEEEGRSLDPEEHKQVEEILAEVGGLKGRLQDFENNEKLQDNIDRLRGPWNVPAEIAQSQAKSIGEAFTKSEAFQALKAGNLGGKWTTGPVELPWDFKATMTTTASPVVQPQVSGGILPLLAQPLRIANLLMDGTTDSNTVRYVQETTATNAAAATAEGALKPESTLILNQVDEPVRKIATFLPVADEMLEDVAQLQSYLNGRLSIFVQQAEEAQIYGGSGVAPQLLGLTGRTGVQTQAKGTDSVPDAIFKAMTKVRNTFLEPDGIVMHPADWEEVRLAKDANQQYYGGGPFTGAYGVNGIASDSLWGKPVVVTTAATQNTALVGAFRTAAQLFRRNTLSVEASNSHSDFFAKNLTAIRAEQRLALAVYRPAAFCTVTGV